MDQSQPVVRTDPSPNHAERHPAADGHERWIADRDRLLTIAGYAESLVEAIHRVDRAYEEAASALAEARREAATIRADAEREAEIRTARAREELARLEFQIARLESARQLIAVPRASLPAAVTPDPVTLAEHPSETAREFPQPELLSATPPALADAPWSALTEAGQNDPVEPEPPADDVSAHVRSIRKLLEERADRREPDVAPAPRRAPFGTAVAIAATVLALSATAWWFVGGRNGDRAQRAAAQAASPTPDAAARHLSNAAETAAPAVDTPPVRRPLDKVSVTITAQRATWVRLGSDGVLDRGRIFGAGQQQVITGDREVEVRTGDGGALMVSVNDGPETRMGENGQDAVKRFALADVAGASDGRGHAASAPKESDAVSVAERTSVATSGIADPASAPSRSAREEIADAEARWFNARYSGADAVLHTLQARDFQLLDQRGVGDRPAPGVPVEREIRSLQIDTWADHAAASGVMVERVRGASPREVMSVFAETWVKREGRWQLMGLRITTPSGTPSSH